jgi:cysteine desulfuration protein SufE
MSITEKGEQLEEEFALFDDAFDKFAYLIDLGKELAPMDAALKTDIRKIKGCQANVWLNSEFKDGKVFFEADADADYAKGMVSMMIFRTYSR